MHETKEAVQWTLFPNGISIIVVNWLREGKRFYLAILPTRLWQCFRELLSFDSSDVENVVNIVKQSIGIDFEQLRKIYCQVIGSNMETSELRVLDGRASPESARDCRINGLDLIADKYCKAWEKFGLVLPVLF